MYNTEINDGKGRVWLTSCSKRISWSVSLQATSMFGACELIKTSGSEVCDDSYMMEVIQCFGFHQVFRDEEASPPNH